MEGPDGVRIVFLNAGERRNRGALLTEPGRQYSECVTSAQTVADPDACIDFWKSLGASVFVDFWMEADAALAAALRLPLGARFRFTLLMSEGDRNARVELLHFPNGGGRDLRGRSQAAGIRGFGLRAEIPTQRGPNGELLFSTPAYLRI